MPAEQPPKSICEICGGTHSTAAHISTVENAQEEESAQEKEPNREAIKKVVDIFATEDLKYRDIRFVGSESLIPTLETGVATPLTSFLYEPFGKMGETTKKQIEELKAKRELERDMMVPGMRLGGMDKSFRQQGNVYYPEGLLKALRDKFIGTSEVKIYGKAEQNEPRRSEDPASGGLIHLCKAWFSLDSTERVQFSQLIGSTEDEVSKFLTDWLAGIEPKDQIEPRREVIKKILRDPVIWETLRIAWLEIYWGKRKDLAGRHYSWEEHSSFRIGMVLSPNVDVAVSPHGDFPTQATIMSPRVKPKDIIGLAVSDSAFSELSRNYFQSPKYPVSYLLKKFARPFFRFLTERGFAEVKLKEYYEKFSEWDNKEKKRREKALDGLPYTDPDGSYSKVRSRTEREEMEKSYEILSSNMRNEFGDEVFNAIEEYAKKFIDEKSPVKDGETEWTALVRLAEKHQLPIYNLRGEMTWPKQMTHEELAQFVTEKSEEKE